MACRTKTQHFPGFLEESIATNLYERLRDNTEWHEGIRSKTGKTRLAYRVDDFESLEPDLQELLSDVVRKCLQANAGIFGVYYNFYKDGTHYTPNHSHPGTIQAIISLGATRTLVIGKKQIQMANGDVAIFGATTHGIPREPDVKDGRISIALFLKRLN